LKNTSTISPGTGMRPLVDTSAFRSAESAGLTPGRGVSAAAHELLELISDMR